MFQEIEVEKIHPRTVNPNQMTEKEFAAYQREVERLGRPPKPIIVRPLSDGGYEIVDGEHGWRCARDLGMKTVCCEVRELNDFDAARENFLRNRGGTDNPVVLGRMFEGMMKNSEPELTGRGLAKILGIAEGKVRNKLEYLEAYELRIQYAPVTAEEDIARLKQNQVRIYLAMEEEVRDRWLDAGADSAAFDGIADWTSARVTHAISRYKLTQYLPKGPRGFHEAVERIALLAVWIDQHKHIRDAQAYAVAAAEAGVPPAAIASLPLGTDGEQAVALISPTAWQKVLAKARQTAGKPSGLMAEIASGVRLALQDAGIDPADVCSAAEAEALRVIAAAPEFISSAKLLSLKEKCWLAELAAEEDEELIRIAQQMTCEILFQSRSAGRNGHARGKSDSIEAVYDQCLRELMQQEKMAAAQELFEHPDELIQTVVAKLSETNAFRDGFVGEQSAADVLHQRLNSVDWPEFFLLATFVVGEASTEVAARRWLAAIQGSAAQEVEA